LYFFLSLRHPNNRSLYLYFSLCIQLIGQENYSEVEKCCRGIASPSPHLCTPHVTHYTLWYIAYEVSMTNDRVANSYVTRTVSRAAAVEREYAMLVEPATAIRM
jgi:hypothetical protein